MLHASPASVCQGDTLLRAAVIVTAVILINDSLFSLLAHAS